MNYNNSHDVIMMQTRPHIKVSMIRDRVRERESNQEIVNGRDIWSQQTFVGVAGLLQYLNERAWLPLSMNVVEKESGEWCRGTDPD